MSLLERLTDHREPLTDELRAEAKAHREGLLVPLIELLRGENRPRLLRAIDLLVHLEAREAETAFMDLFSHPGQAIRRAAIQAVARLFDQHAPSLDTILLLEAQFVEEEVRSVENNIMDALASFPDKAGLPSLLRICGSGGDIGTRRLLLRLRRMLDGEPGEVWQQALEQVPEYGRQCLARCVDFEPWKSLLKTASPAASAVEASDLDSFGRLFSPGEQQLKFSQALIEAALQRLSESGARHLLVVGRPGVGKTAFLEEVCRRIAQRDTIVLRTSTTTLLAGTKYIGEWQTRVQNLINRTRRPRDVVIWMEDVNHIPFTGVYEGSTANFASVMKPYMDDGSITVIGETTPESLAAGLGSRPDFRRLFSELKLEEPDSATLRDQITDVLDRLAYGAGRELNLPGPARDYLISLASSFMAGIAFPGSVVPILEGAVALLPEGHHPAEIGTDLLVRSAAQRTGLPVWLLEDKSPLDPARARSFFQGQVIGQDQPVEAMVDLITMIKAGLTDPSRPLGVYLFIGPTGVGKTELAKSLAEYVFGSRERLVRIDMSEYKDYDSYRRLIGSEYGGEKEGLLTGKIKQHPFSVILLDEFEKAHPNVYDLMLGLFDDGRLTTARGETVNFCNTVIIMTSNLGQAGQESSLGLLSRNSKISERDTMRAVEGYFSPEFINRIRISMFGPLDLPAMQSIARHEMRQALQRSGIARRGVIVDADDAVVSLLLQRGFNSRYGARPLKRAVEELFLLPIARQLVKGSSGGVLQVRLKNDEIVARFLKEKSVEFQEARLPRGGTVQDLERRWSACSAQVLEQEIEAEYGRLAEQAGQPDFWERPGARVMGARLHRLESLLGQWKALGERLESFGVWLAGPVPPGQANQRHTQAARRYQELASSLDLMELKLRCRDPLLQRDAYLRILPLGPQLPARDGRRALLDMYRGWAARIDCEILVLNDPRGDDDPLVLRVSGPQSFGMLSLEHGLHRFSVTHGDNGNRQAALLKVDVIPAASPDFAFGEGEIYLGGGLIRSGNPVYAERLRSRVEGAHVETSTMVACRNGLELADNETATRDYLAATVAWEEPGQEARVVRSYYFEPDNEVLDAASGLRSRHLDGVLAGELESFLLHV